MEALDVFHSVNYTCWQPHIIRVLCVCVCVCVCMCVCVYSGRTAGVVTPHHISKLCVPMWSFQHEERRGGPVTRISLTSTAHECCTKQQTVKLSPLCRQMLINIPQKCHTAKKRPIQRQLFKDQTSTDVNLWWSNRLFFCRSNWFRH